MNRVCRILSLIFTLALLAPVGFCPSLWAKESRPSDVKANALGYLKDLRSQNVKRLVDIDQALRSRIEDSNPGVVEFEVSRLKLAKREHILRQEFLDRLIFQIDVKFNGGELRPFLERALTEMAKTDATSNDSRVAPDAGLWKFLKFAADAVRRLPEKRENVLIFLEGYMNRSVADPIRPEDYLNTRNYSNGLESESGKQLSRDEVGAVADGRIRGLREEIPAKAPAPATLEPVAPMTPVAPAVETPAGANESVAEPAIN